LVILEKRIAGLREEALQRFVLRARRAAGLNGAVNVLITSSARMRTLNREFRGRNKPTDVLSFPAGEKGGHKSGASAGEIAICAEIARQNASRLGHSPAQEIYVLALHGILHLAGLDHERDNGDMARVETRLRQKLKLPTALIERSAMERPKAALPKGVRRVKASPRTRRRA